ncbi:MAG: type II toxin-antitoxin system RelE family toxin [Planctomycetaceae bacterium]
MAKKWFVCGECKTEKLMEPSKAKGCTKPKCKGVMEEKLTASSKTQQPPQAGNPWNVVSPKSNKINLEQNDAAWANYHSWVGHMRQGHHPKVAAELTGDMNYEELTGAKGQYSIRLTQGDRVLFSVETKQRQVTILAVGGHY